MVERPFDGGLVLLGTVSNSSKKSPFERHYGRSPNTVKEILTKLSPVSADDPNLAFSDEDFQRDQDSAILVRERSRGSKLDGLFTKRRGYLVDETPHTVSLQTKPSQNQLSSANAMLPVPTNLAN